MGLHDEQVKQTKQRQSQIHTEKNKEVWEEKKVQPVDSFAEQTVSSEARQSAEEVIAEGFEKVTVQADMDQLEGDIPKQAEYEVMKNKQAAAVSGTGIPSIEQLKKEIEYNKVQTLPPQLQSVLDKIESWTGKLSEDSSLPLVRAVKSIRSASTEDEMGRQLADLTKAALDYRKMRAGFRFTSSGRMRQRDVNELIKAIGGYLPEARESYAKKISEALKGGASSADDMPEKYREFYKENTVVLEKPVDMDEYLDSIYGEKCREQKNADKYHREPIGQVKLSEMTAREFADQFSQDYNDTLSKEEREEELKNRKSPLYAKQQNKEKLLSIAEAEKIEYDDNLTEEKFTLLIDDYMKIDIKGLDLSSDKAIVNSASRMEAMVQKNQRFTEAINKYKERYKKLPEDTRRYLERQIKSVTAITSYYRVCKMIITDDLYSTRLDKELSLGAKYSEGYEKYRLSVLLMLKMKIEQSLAEVCPEDADVVNATMSAKDTYKLDFTVEKEKAEALQKERAKLLSGYANHEFEKSSYTPSTKNSIHHEVLKGYVQGTKENDVLSVKGETVVDGIKQDDDFFRNVCNLSNLHSVNGLGMAKQELSDMVSDLMSESQTQVTRGVKKLRDLFVAHGRYIVDKYGSAFMYLRPDEALEHGEEIKQDLCLLTNLVEGLAFFKRCPSIYENSELWHEMEDIAQKLSAISCFNMGNASAARRDNYDEEENVCFGEAGVLSIVTDACTGNMVNAGNAVAMFEANSTLTRLETMTKEQKVKWEGTRSEAELKKAQELSALGEAAYVIKKQKEVPPLTSKEAAKVKHDVAKAKLNSAAQSLPPLRELTLDNVNSMLESWKDARIQWDAVKRSAELTEEEKKQYEDFAKRYDLMEEYLDAYSTAIRHPGFVKLSLRGWSLPADGSLEPQFTAHMLSLYMNGGAMTLSPDEVGACEALRDVAEAWIKCVGRVDSEVRAVREAYYGNAEKDKTKSGAQLAAEATMNAEKYNGYITANMEAYAKENNVELHGVTGRKLNVLMTAASVLEGVSLDECKKLYTGLSSNFEKLEKTPEAVTAKVKASEMILDVLMNIDFSTIHLDDENILENAGPAVVMTRFGMEVDDLFKDYLKIRESGIVKDMKFNDDQLVELKGRYEALTALSPLFVQKLKIMENAQADTPEGKELMKLDFEGLNAWLPAHRDADPSLIEFANNLFSLKQSEMLFSLEHNGAQPSVDVILKENIELAKKDLFSA